MRLSNSQAAPPAPGGRRWDASVVAAASGTGAALLAYLLGVVVPLGRGVDGRAVRWAERAGAGAQPWVHALLAYLSPVLVAVGVVLVVLRELRRGDRISAVRVVALVTGSELLAQALKVSLPRPGGGTNTLPSGHVTMIAALMVAIAAVGGWRGVTIMLGTFVVAVAALGTMIIGWHRPSDIVAACGVVAVCWAAVRLIGRARRRPDRHRCTRLPDTAPFWSGANRPTVPGNPSRAGQPVPAPSTCPTTGRAACGSAAESRAQESGRVGWARRAPDAPRADATVRSGQASAGRGWRRSAGGRLRSCARVVPGTVGRPGRGRYGPAATVAVVSTAVHDRVRRRERR